jgi:rhodanese-related sulfurtransferase
MKWKIAAVAMAVVGLALVLTGCVSADKPNDAAETPSAQVEKGTVTTIDAATAYERMNASDEYTLIDVRTPDEFSEGHIAGAILLPDYDIEARAAEVLPDKDAVIYVYCRSGRRSAASSDLLAEMGYTNIYDMGGIIDWPYGTVTGND